MGAIETTPMDTHPDVYALQLELLSRLSPEQRVANIVGIAEATEMMERFRLRQRYPNASESEMSMLVAVDRYGAEFVRNISGWSSDSLQTQ